MNRLEAIEQEFGFAEQTGRWRAEKGEHYWYINTLFEATKGTERGNKANDIHFNSGNYFATYEKAAITATRMQKDIGRIAEAVEKQIPQKARYLQPLTVDTVVGGLKFKKGTSIITECSSCRTWIRKNDKYCNECGQKLDWSDDNE